MAAVRVAAGPPTDMELTESGLMARKVKRDEAG